MQVEHEGVDKSADIDETPIIKPTQEEQKGMQIMMSIRRFQMLHWHAGLEHASRKV